MEIFPLKIEVTKNLVQLILLWEHLNDVHVNHTFAPVRLLLLFIVVIIIASEK